MRIPSCRWPNLIQWMMLDEHEVTVMFSMSCFAFVISSKAYVDPPSTELNSIIIISVHTVDTNHGPLG